MMATEATSDAIKSDPGTAVLNQDEQEKQGVKIDPITALQDGIGETIWF